MRLLPLGFFLITYLILKTMVIIELEPQTLVFPTLDLDTNLEFIAIDNIDCGILDLAGCVEYVGTVLYNIGIAIIWVVLDTVALAVYAAKLTAMFAGILIEGIPGAPTWLNFLIASPLALAFAIIVFKLFRSGDDEA